MSDGKRKFVMGSAAIRERVIAYLYELPFDVCAWDIRIKPHAPDKTRDQENKYHAMLDDIARSGKFELLGRRKWTQLAVKRLLIDAFAKARVAEGRPLRHSTGEILPALDGSGFVYVENSSREFAREEASDFIEYLYAYGAEIGVQWSDKVRDME